MARKEVFSRAQHSEKVVGVNSTKGELGPKDFDVTAGSIDWDLGDSVTIEVGCHATSRLYLFGGGT